MTNSDFYFNYRHIEMYLWIFYIFVSQGVKHYSLILQNSFFFLWTRITSAMSWCFSVISFIKSIKAIWSQAQVATYIMLYWIRTWISDHVGHRPNRQMSQNTLSFFRYTDTNHWPKHMKVKCLCTLCKYCGWHTVLLLFFSRRNINIVF